MLSVFINTERSPRRSRWGIGRPPPSAITTVVAQEVNWPSIYEVVGSLEASQGIVVSAEDPGKVVRIAFDSGAAVKKGDVLVQLDTSVEEAKLTGGRGAAVFGTEKSKAFTNSPIRAGKCRDRSKFGRRLKRGRLQAR